MRPRIRMTSLAAATSLVAAAAGCQSAEPSVVETKPSAVSVSTPLVRPVVDYDAYTGRTRAVATVDIRSRVQGYLKEIRFEAGDLVEAGQILFVIDPREYEDAVALAEARLEQARAQARLTAVERERYRILAQRDVGSRQDFDRAAAAYDVSVAEAKGVEAELDRVRLDLSFTEVRSPIAGQAGAHLVDVGNLITAGQTDANLLTAVVAVDPMYVDFDVDERALLKYRKTAADRRGEEVDPAHIREARIPVEMGLADEPGFPHVGILDFADNRLDPDTGTLRARGVFPNADRLLTPGLFARVRIPVGELGDAVLVAETAIGSDQGIRFAYALGEGDRVERRLITVGPAIAGMAVITEGLSPEDRVLVSGIQRVREGIAVTPQDVPMPMPPGADEALASAASEAPEAPPADLATSVANAAAGMEPPPEPEPTPGPETTEPDADAPPAAPDDR
ncbi:efflux RND transporter periplasmic adaptor subunit [Tautonia plasticadhaerens]|uniref:Solvent efflux pump periplasmic linker SrpA n=1 Tax=Tautonia plasticadhaerens TaxID=2527974 RepID=A0A518H1N0_9BACT|nr:efflux RND transporter periplasmic adaptor subunit [Tautonia plasticadhaerens]QDV34749.1 Solvent efflux pump periplasmic linker SrpA precursor [Tautonia plasticadhaerens]